MGLQALAAEYRLLHPSRDPLCYNDMSLIRGGVFDLQFNFVIARDFFTGKAIGSHQEHQDGRAADLRIVTIQRDCLGVPGDTQGDAEMRQLLNAIFGHDDHLRHPDDPIHWHIRHENRFAQQ